jgi:ABC-type amino acid transport system permease subunit
MNDRRELPARYGHIERNVLRAITALSLALTIAGLAIDLARDGDQPSARTLVRVGVALMLATPLVRLLLLGVAYLGIRDWLYATLVAVVAAVIASGFLFG